jgi:hypothetical protein
VYRLHRDSLIFLSLRSGSNTNVICSTHPRPTQEPTQHAASARWPHAWSTTLSLCLSSCVMIGCGPSGSNFVRNFAWCWANINGRQPRGLFCYSRHLADLRPQRRETKENVRQGVPQSLAARTGRPTWRRRHWAVCWCPVSHGCPRSTREGFDGMPWEARRIHTADLLWEVGT